MSNADWKTIEELDQRFSQLIGLSTEEQLQRLKSNWHLISALARGRLDELIEEEFIPMEAVPEVGYVAWGKWRERIRHFPVMVERDSTLAELCESAQMAFKASAELCYRTNRPEDRSASRGVRLKQLRHDGQYRIRELEVMLRAKFLTHARIDHLIAIAKKFPDQTPDNLVAFGSSYRANIGTPHEKTMVPYLRRQKDGRFELGTGIIGGAFENAVLKDGHTILAVRYPLPPDHPFRRLDPVG